MLLSLIPVRRIITLQFASISRHGLSTTLLRSWLSRSNTILLHSYLFEEVSASWCSSGVASGRSYFSLIESVGLSNHFLHHTEPSKVRRKLPIKDEWARLHSYEELLSSTLCPLPIRVGNPLKILCKRRIPSFVNFFVAVEWNITLQNRELDGSVANIAVIVDCCKFVFTVSFSWSILYTRAASGIIFGRIASLSQDISKINPCCSQFVALFFFWIRWMSCTNVRVSSPLRYLPLQMLPHCKPIPTLWVRLPWGWKGRPYYLLA